MDYEEKERPHQYWVRKRLVDINIDQDKAEVMLELAPRFGKTHS